MPQPYRFIPQPRKIIDPLSVGPGRPSSNLGHVMNQTLTKSAHLFDKIGTSNPIPFDMIQPTKPANSRRPIAESISAAVLAIAKPTIGTTARGNVDIGTRIKAVLDSLRNTL